MSEKKIKRSSIFRSPEMLTALSAVVMGVCALAVAFYQAQIMRTDQRTSVLPLVELNHSTVWSAPGDGSGDPMLSEISFLLENVGIGPAKIINFNILVDDSQFESWDDALRELSTNTDSPGFSSATMAGRIVPAGRSIQFFGTADPNLAQVVNQSFSRIEVRACYCSIFDDCWTVGSQDFGVSEEVNSCDAARKSQN